MKYLLIIFLFISCSKENLLPSPHCETIIMLSDKYNSWDSSFIRTDTISWNGGNEIKRTLCDSTLSVFKLEAAKQEKTFLLCGLNMLEKRRYLYY